MYKEAVVDDENLSSKTMIFHHVAPPAPLQYKFFLCYLFLNRGITFISGEMPFTCFFLAAKMSEDNISHCKKLGTTG